jgi:pilus assembly protein Flp/PilA
MNGRGEKPHLADQSGISAIEYALLASLVAMVIIISVIALSGAVEGLYENLNNALP